MLRHIVTKEDKKSFIGNRLEKLHNLEIIFDTHKCAILANTSFCNNRQPVNDNTSYHKKPKTDKLKKRDGAIFIVEDEIKTELQLMDLATTTKNLGDRCLYE